MSIESEQIFTLDTFRSVVLDGFFVDCPAPLTRRGRDLCRFAWELDGRCHTQDWEGARHRLALFSLPIHLRRNPVSKNYAALWRPLPGEDRLHLEIVLPSRRNLREAVLARLDFSAARSREGGHPRFAVSPEDDPARFFPYILAAREAKLRPLAARLKEPRTGPGSPAPRG